MEKINIYERVINNKSQKKIGLKVFFMAQKNEIEQAMKKGCSVLSIWEVLHEDKSFEGSYKTFCKYVRDHITNNPKKTTSLNTTKAKKSPSEKSKKQFNWSPHYDEKDLL